MNQLKTACRKFVERAEYLGYKGKRRDEAALDFICGWAGAMADAKHPELNHITNCLAMIIAVRGYAEVKRIAETPDE